MDCLRRAARQCVVVPEDKCYKVRLTPGAAGCAMTGFSCFCSSSCSYTRKEGCPGEGRDCSGLLRPRLAHRSGPSVEPEEDKGFPKLPRPSAGACWWLGFGVGYRCSLCHTWPLGSWALGCLSSEGAPAPGPRQAAAWPEVWKRLFLSSESFVLWLLLLSSCSPPCTVPEDWTSQAGSVFLCLLVLTC